MIRREITGSNIGAINEEFAGRFGEPGYDGNKPIQIHRLNRVYAWKREMELALLDSILNNYHIPEIIMCSKDGIRYVMDGGNRITAFRKILNGEVRTLTDTERFIVLNFPIQLVNMRNLSPSQQRTVFQRLNKSVKVTDGQLYVMSAEDSPLVILTCALLKDIAYPFRARMNDVFTDRISKDDPRGTNIENAVAIISGSLHGVIYISKSFSKQQEWVDSQEPVDVDRVNFMMDLILTVFERANAEFPLTDNQAKKSLFTIGKYIGGMMYDFMTQPDALDEMKTKWVRYIVMVRQNVEHACEAIEIPGAQNINPDKLKKKSARVELFLQEGRIATEEETRQMKHVYADEVEDTDTDEDDAEEN